MKKLLILLLLLLPLGVNAASIKYVGKENSFIEIDDNLFGISAKLNGNSSIEIENLSSYSSIFSTGNYKNYPLYLININGKYTFSDFKKDEATEIFIEKNRSYDLINLENYNLENTCDAVFGYQLINFLKNNVFKFTYYLIPILLIVLSSVDFAKIIFSNDKDDLPKAFQRFGKRVTASVLIFLTPNVLILLINIIGSDEIKSCIETFKTVENVDENTN